MKRCGDLEGKNKARRVEELVREQRLFAIIRSGRPEPAQAAAEAVIDAGLRLVMLTMTVPGVFDLLERIAQGGEAVVGIGSVTSLKEAVEAIDRGACFVDCPNTDRTIIDYCRDNDVFVAAGGLTPTEMMTAHQAGVDLIKVFPVAAMGGVGYIRYVLEPMPFLRLMPVGGIEPEAVAGYIQAGATAIGASSTLIHTEALERGDLDFIRNHAREFLENIQRAIS
jgi:2-dehydro-3-deoxyphosphogluconate aldolase/(4S)-4-hydroxy-2-oxoglutarate aldolase